MSSEVIRVRMSIERRLAMLLSFDIRSYSGYRRLQRTRKRIQDAGRFSREGTERERPSYTADSLEANVHFNTSRGWL